MEKHPVQEFEEMKNRISNLMTEIDNLDKISRDYEMKERIWADGEGMQ